VGRTDLPTGDREALLLSLERLKELGVERLYPGHGPFTEQRGKEHILDAIEFMKFGEGP
jgi:glyoxylase-like metal-dependent hydrolase (beta-lactamase superfamily II)